MANAIRYSTTGDTQSLKSGNFFFGVGDVGKGPSSATTYYNGITPVVSGYTIYTYNASQTSKISFASANSDSELVTITNNLSGQNFTTATQCLNWYVTQSNYVCVNKDYEGIVTDGLVVNLDAGYNPSYTSSGTTWYDLSYNGNDGILVNGPTFNSTNGGSILFDGVDDKVTTTVSQVNTTSLQYNSVEMWMRWNGETSNGFPMEFSSYRLWFASLSRFGFNRGASDNYGFNPSSLSNVWVHLVALFYNGTYTNNSKIYINGIEQSLSQLQGSDGVVSASSQVTIGGYRLSSSYPFNGSIANFRIYNRALNPSEVLQNYQAQFPRFLGKNIVTNGLVQYLDAGYVNSYPTTGTTWTNISGVSGGTGTLTNGPTYSGGTINFDGTNDYVDCGSGSSLNLRFLTLDCWVNPSIVSGGNGVHRHLIAYELCYKVRFNGDSIQVLLGDGTNWHSVFTTNFGIINANSWYNVTVNVTPLNTCNIYVNGVLTNTQNTSAIGNNERKLFIGAFDSSGGAPSAFFNGKMASSSIYNRALTSSEVLQNYQAQFPTILGEKIITNGLVLYLDAGYRTSYPTTGTTWTNVSGVSGGTGTLTNGPTYTGTSGGAIVFDGTDDRVNGTIDGSIFTGNFTQTAWIYKLNNNQIWQGVFTNSSPSVNNTYLMTFGNGSTAAPYNSIGVNQVGVSESGIFLDIGSHLNRWLYVAITKIGNRVNIYCYKDGSLLSNSGTITWNGGNFATTNSYIIGRHWGGSSVIPFQGYMSNVSVYNRPLTQNEIQQNFNAQKSRYGL